MSNFGTSTFGRDVKWDVSYHYEQDISKLLELRAELRSTAELDHDDMDMESCVFVYC